MKAGHFLKELYFKKIENLLGRILYLHNTINSHFLLMGGLGVLFYHFSIEAIFGQENFLWFLIYALITTGFFYFVFSLADFYVLYLVFVPLIFFLLSRTANFSFGPALILIIINTALFFLTQFIFFGMAYIIILKDLTTPFRITVNSLFTLASTTASFFVCLFFTSLFSLTLLFQPNPLVDYYSLGFFTLVFLASLITRKFVPRNRLENYSLPTGQSKVRAKRVILLNIDGCSFKKFSQAKKPHIEKLKKKAVFFRKGALTVYRGLTNPAFASILTGTIPKIHGVIDNNLGSRVKTIALPDIVKTILYGCVHMAQFSKKTWNVKVVSLPQYGFRADEVVLDWLKKDIEKNERTRLFVVDLSSVDMAGHAYGSYSRQYMAEIERADRLIGRFLEWLKAKDYLDDSIIIISSDHGMKIIDHVYLLFPEEREVPLLFYGDGVKRGVKIDFQPSIMDIAPTISYALGMDYPEKIKARVLMEIFK